MTPRTAWLAAIAASLVLAGFANAEGSTDATDAHQLHAADGLSWTDAPESLPPGARMAILHGDPATQGMFALRFEMPANYTIPAHTHPADEHVTILSGVGHLTMDGHDTVAMEEGAFVRLPHGMVHAFAAGDAPVVIQLHGEGPWGITYVDAADDPRNA